MIRESHIAIRVLAVALLVAAMPGGARARSVLFDASHRENAGNADWVIDADLFDLNQPHYPCGQSDFEDESRAQRFPTPPASGVVPTTDESYWTGGISAFGVDLVKLGFDVETLPPGGGMTFGDGGNPQDLANYDVFVLPEPNLPFTASETMALRDFVAAGGGLFLIADHQTSDRDCDGQDSPHILNDVMGVVVGGGQITDHGLFGIVFNVDEISGLTSDDYWFTDAVDDNVTGDLADPIIHGPHGDGSGGLGLFGSTAMTIDPAANPSVTAHVWKSDAAGQGTTRVTFATALYGNGRVACIGDSSPADDGTGDVGDTLYLGWDKASGGVANREIHLNAVEWLAGDDTVAPTITSSPIASPSDCSAAIAWSTDEPATGAVDYGPTAAYGSSATDPTPTLNPVVMLGGLIPGSLYHFSVTSTDPAGNASVPSADAIFVTENAAPPAFAGGPAAVGVGATSATIVWTTDEPADGRVDYGTTTSYGAVQTGAASVLDHAIPLSALAPSTTYHYSVSTSDGCGNGPTASADAVFTTAPPEIDISGWIVRQFDSSQSFAFPPGTLVPGGGYLVLARDASQAAFEAEWGPLPAGVTFLDSAGVFPFINGGESFRLEDEVGAIVDGVTIAMSSGQTIERVAPGAAAGDPGSWTVSSSAFGTPGDGAGPTSNAGIVINEASDATAFGNEFVELFYDAVPSGPDTVPPSDVGDLRAVPLSDDVVRLSWTAPGDDGASGAASGYDVRVATSPILSEALFAAATPLAGEPIPQSAGATESWDVSGLDPETTYYFALQAVDEAANRSGTSNSSGATTGEIGASVPAVADHIVISEIRTRGVVDQNDEFIELHNPTASAVGLAGWSVQYKSASGTGYLRLDLPDAGIPPHGYFLLSRPEFTGSAIADATWSSFLMSASGGRVFLAATAADLTSCTDVAIVDAIGYGSGDCPEGSAAIAHGAGESLERAPGIADPLCGNGTDTDDNSVDVAVLASPDPQNSAGPGEAPCVSLGNVGASVFFEGRTAMRWGAALAAVDYKVRRATAADFMQTNPVPDDTHLLERTTATSLDDPAEPPSGAVFHYFVTATDGASGESLN